MLLVITAAIKVACDLVDRYTANLSTDIVTLLAVVSGLVCLCLIAITLAVCCRYYYYDCCERCDRVSACVANLRLPRRRRTCDVERGDAGDGWNDAILWTAGRASLDRVFSRRYGR